jgi:hypothetical protein
MIYIVKRVRKGDKCLNKREYSSKIRVNEYNLRLKIIMLDFKRYESPNNINLIIYNRGFINILYLNKVKATKNEEKNISETD